jgi:hypothetical protein
MCDTGFNLNRMLGGDPTGQKGIAGIDMDLSTGTLARDIGAAVAAATMGLVPGITGLGGASAWGSGGYLQPAANAVGSMGSSLLGNVATGVGSTLGKMAIPEDMTYVSPISGSSSAPSTTPTYNIFGAANTGLEGNPYFATALSEVMKRSNKDLLSMLLRRQGQGNPQQAFMGRTASSGNMFGGQGGGMSVGGPGGWGRMG